MIASAFSKRLHRESRAFSSAQALGLEWIQLLALALLRPWVLALVELSDLASVEPLALVLVELLVLGSVELLVLGSVELLVLVLAQSAGLRHRLNQLGFRLRRNRMRLNWCRQNYLLRLDLRNFFRFGDRARQYECDRTNGDHKKGQGNHCGNQSVFVRVFVGLFLTGLWRKLRSEIRLSLGCGAERN